jgi:serine/threonine protein kinase
MSYSNPEYREENVRSCDPFLPMEENDNSMWDATQHGEAVGFSELTTSHITTVSNPDVDVWGVLRRRGGNQEEFKMLHRMKDGKRDTYVLGRNVASCDITSAHKSVSSTHCRIYCDYTQARLRVFLEDSSGNGTFVNDSLTRLTRGERMELKSGDEIFLINPRILQSKSSSNDAHGDHPKKGAHNDVGSTSFTFVNIRERVAATREKSRAPSHSQLAPCSRHVEDVYVIGDQIGSGMCGIVHLCIERATGLHCAVKIIDTKKFALSPGLTPADLREEAAMMMTLDHPNIIRIKDTFETDNIIFIVMELVRGGDLFDRIVEKGKYKEDEAREVMQKVLSAVKYLHSKDIIHRDLKPENILLMEPNNDTEVKITDFGLAKRTNQEGLKTFCGTPQYFAPEVLKRKNTVKGLGSYGTAADMWSLGVVLFILLSGAFPFDDDNLLEQIQNAHYSLAGAEWSSISDTAKHFVRSMMTLRPDQRLTVEQALEHPWMKNEPFPERTKSLMQFVSHGLRAGDVSTANDVQEPARGSKKVTGASGPKRKNTGKDMSKNSTKMSTGINRKQTSGSQGILQLLAASSNNSKEKLKGVANPLPGGGNDTTGKSHGADSVKSLAVAAAYMSYARCE